MSEIAKNEEPPESDVKQSEEINISEIAKDDFLHQEIHRHGVIQANIKHWQPDKSSAKFIFKLCFLVLRLVTFKCMLQNQRF